MVDPIIMYINGFEKYSVNIIQVSSIINKCSYCLFMYVRLKEQRSKFASTFSTHPND